MLMACRILTKHRGINMDHLPIVTKLSLGVMLQDQEPVPNFREVDWEAFCKVLDEHVLPAQPEEIITSQELLDQCCDELTRAL
jgi:hypothetical protein